MGETRGLYWLRWKDNIRMDLQEVGFGGLVWVEMAEDRDR
jgi:hypothetical protein